MVHLSLLSVYNFIRRGLVRGLAEKTTKSKSMALKSKSKSYKSGFKSGLKSKSALEYHKSDQNSQTLTECIVLEHSKPSFPCLPLYL